MSILNVNQLQPVGGGNTITVGSSNIDYSGSITGNISVDGNLTVTGVVSHEDVTNIDSVGVITARNGIDVTGGNLDIGGATHSRNLTVHDATNGVILIEGASNGTSNLMFADENDEDVGMLGYNHASNYLAFTVNAAERLRITSTGKLEAYKGTSTTGKTLGSEAFTVGNGANNKRFSVYPDGSTVIGGQGVINNYNILLQNNGQAVFSGIVAAQSGIHVTGGSVGIGTDTIDANSQLHIKNTSGNAKITLETNETYDSYINFSGATSEASIGYEPTSNAVVISNAADGLTSAERLRIASDGKISIAGDNNSYLYRSGLNTWTFTLNSSDTFRLYEDTAWILSNNITVNPNNTGSEIQGAMLRFGNNIWLQERYPNGAYSDRQDLVLNTDTGYGLGQSDKVRFISDGSIDLNQHHSSAGTNSAISSPSLKFKGHGWNTGSGSQEVGTKLQSQHAYWGNNYSSAYGQTYPDFKILIKNSDSSTYDEKFAFSGNGVMRLQSGGGINFHNYGSGTNISSNILDDYEEGSFTITTSGISNLGTLQTARYTKVGNQVTYMFNIYQNNNNMSWSAGSYFSITAFTPISNFHTSPSISWFSNVSTSDTQPAYFNSAGDIVLNAARSGVRHLWGFVTVEVQ